MRKLVSISFEEFKLLRFAITLAIQHYNRLDQGIFTDENTLTALDGYDDILKRLSNTFNTKRKPDFD